MGKVRGDKYSFWGNTDIYGLYNIIAVLIITILLIIITILIIERVFASALVVQL